MQTSNTLGRYQILRELARSNDIVYEARDPSGLRVALKELQVPANLVGRARTERIARFTREARAAASLKHPNIVHIHDHGDVQGRYFIAMEFLQGQSLRDVLRQRGALPASDAINIAAKVAEGLAYAHKHGVVHRDVKPDNVHMEPDGRVVITDFGIARLTFEPTLTAEGQVFGTPSYMSPEQVTGKGIDHRSDVFSLGVMLYEMVAGRKPFSGDSVITITYNIMNMEPSPLANGPTGLDAVIRRAMAKDPNRRYANCAELIEDLQSIQQGRRPAHADRMPPARVGGAAPARPSGTQARHPAPPAPRPQPRPAPRAAGPLPHPAPGYPAPVRQGASPGAPVRGARPAAPPTHQIPAPVPVYHSSPQRGGLDLRWLLGWLGLAVLVGLMIIGIVWVSVTALDRFRVETSVRDAERAHTIAAADFQAGRYEEALRGYLAAEKGLSGPRLLVVQKNAANAAVALADRALEQKDAARAESFARQAVQQNPDEPAARLSLGRALALLGRVDEALQEFGQVEGAAERARRTDTPAEAALHRKTVEALPLWRAATTYADGVALAETNPQLARQRFQMTVDAAPASDFARNARDYILRIDSAARAGTPLSPPSDPPGGQPGGVGGSPERPPGWTDPGFRASDP